VGGTILWDVDTQVDFIEPAGKLYFAGAEEARLAMARLVEAARAAGIVHVASCDQHELSDPEISEEPDYDSTWPPHCLLGTRGAEKIAETKQLDPLPLPLVAVPAAPLRRLLDGRREILIPKKQYDPFTNPNTETLLDRSTPTRFSSSALRPISVTTWQSVLSSGAAVASLSSRTRHAGPTSRVSLLAPPPGVTPGSVSRQPRRRLPHSAKGCVPCCR
jgi:hypothetical protein